jgi:hypothetical protein
VDHSDTDARSAQADADGPRATEGHQTRRDSLIRICAHVSVWLTFVLSATRAMVSGWRPVGDDATIAVKAYQSLGSRPPVLGHVAIQLGETSPVFDVGPWHFYLLAVPVHIDPLRGLLWGSALACAAVLSLAIEALWRSFGELHVAVFVGAVLLVVINAPILVAHVAWNPYFGMFWLFATFALAYVVARGRTGWFPALVAVAAVTICAHTLYDLICVLVLVAAVALSAVARPLSESRRHYVIGVAVGAVMALPTILQQLLGRSGNLSALWHWSRVGTPLGWRFGLSALGSAARPQFVTYPSSLGGAPTGFHQRDIDAVLSGTSPLVGVLVLAVIVACLVVGVRRRRPELVTGAALVLAASVGLVVSFSRILTRVKFGLDYMQVMILPLSVALWGLVAATVVSEIDARRHVVAPRHARAALATVLGVLLAISLGTLAASKQGVATSYVSVARANRLVASVDASARGGGVVVTGESTTVKQFVDETSDSFGVIYQLLTQGYSPWAGGLLKFEGLDLSRPLSGVELRFRVVDGRLRDVKVLRITP